MLHLEAGVYNAFPRYFMHDYWQYVDVAGTAAAPTPAVRPPFGSRGGATSPPSGRFLTNAVDHGAVTARWIEPAVVPKFYGYYTAVAPDGGVIMPMHVECSPDAACDVSWPTRILLVEECGRPIFPQLFTQEHKYAPDSFLILLLRAVLRLTFR